MVVTAARSPFPPATRSGERYSSRYQPPSGCGARFRRRMRSSARTLDTRVIRGDAGSDRLDGLNQLRRRLLSIAVQHARIVEIEQRILDAGEARALAALDDNDVLRLVRVQNRHAIDGARLVGARDGVDHVVGADDEDRKSV